jgi:hypothetical protein
LLLVVDGLDEDLRPPGTPSVAALLPPEAGGRAHVLVSSRLYHELPADLPPGHPLTHMQPVEVQPFKGGQELAKLARQEIAGLVRRPEHLAIRAIQSSRGSGLWIPLPCQQARYRRPFAFGGLPPRD